MRISDWSSDLCSSDLLPERHYHFPKTYLKQVEAAVGDWIVYYEPRRTTGDVSSSGGRQTYFATARLDSIAVDPARADHFYAQVSQYLEFDRPVSFVEGAQYYEGSLRKDDGTTNKRSEEHTSELQSLMRNSYAVFCLKKKKTTNSKRKHNNDM